MQNLPAVGGDQVVQPLASVNLNDGLSVPGSGGSSAVQIPAINITVPEEASDTDLIEKEWVERAKQIVDHTREDPYEQQKALSQMKADYMKKRYNKDIKLPK